MKEELDNNLYTREERAEKHYEFQSRANSGAQIFFRKLNAVDEIKKADIYKKTVKVSILNYKSILESWNRYNNEYVNHNNLTEDDDEYDYIYMNGKFSDETDIRVDAITNSIASILEKLNKSIDRINNSIGTNEVLSLLDIFAQKNETQEDEGEVFEEMDSEENLPC